MFLKQPRALLVCMTVFGVMTKADMCGTSVSYIMNQTFCALTGEEQVNMAAP